MLDCIILRLVQWQIIVLVLLSTLATLGTSQSKVKLKPVTTYLNAKWPNTPLLLEAAEYMADESSAAFWGFIETNTHMDYDLYHRKNDQGKFEELLDRARNILSESQLNLLKLSLSMRIYSAKIEMFRQISLDNKLPATDDCRTVVIIGDLVTCSVSEMLHMIDSIDGLEKPYTLEVDHHYPGGENNKISAILYGNVGDKTFLPFHSTLKSLSEKGTVDYILRPYIKNPIGGRVRLSGYGVELQIKSTEYKAQDDTKVEEEGSGNEDTGDSNDDIDGFIFSKLLPLHVDKQEELQQLRTYLLDSAHDLAPMKVWQLQHLSMQAAQRIMAAPESDKLNLFLHTSQNFPVLARSLTRTKVDDQMKKEIIKNQNQLQSQIDLSPTDSALFVNGMYFDMEYTDIYTLFDHIRNEQRVMEGLHKLGVSGDDLSSLLALEISENKLEYGIDIRDSAIVWMNNIETDKAYKKWPATVGELLRPAYPGMLRNIRKNFNNLVMVVDPVKSETADLLRLIEGFMNHLAPVRLGIVLSVNPDQTLRGLDDVGIAFLCAFNFVVDHHEGKENANQLALQFMVDVYKKATGGATVEDVTSLFISRFPGEDIDDVFGVDSDFDVGRRLAKEYVQKTGFKQLPQALFNGVPLPDKHLNGDEFEEVVLMEVMRMTQVLQRAVYKGELNDRIDMLDWLMAMPNIMPRLNERILTNKFSSHLDMSSTTSDSISSLPLDDFASLNAPDLTGVIANSCHYISTKNEPILRPLTVWVVGDFDTPEGRELMLEAVKYTRESNGVRVCGIHNRVSSNMGLISSVVEVAQSALAPSVSRQFLSKILNEDNVKKLIEGTKKLSDFEVTGLDIEAFQSRLEAIDSKKFEVHGLFSSKVLSLSPGKRTIVANGRIMGVFDDRENFNIDDFALLEKHITATLTDKITEVLTKTSTNDMSELLMKVSGVLQTKPQSKNRVTVPLRSEQFSVIKLPAADLSRPAFDILAICDPVSGAAQKLGPLVQILHQVLNANIRVVLNAMEKHSEMPLKSFYRYVLEAEPQFNDNGEYTPGPFARFTALPESPILTQNYHVPENWLVEVVQSLYDLDNIKLENVETGVHSEFELENLLLEGHCFEQSSGNPPRGLQFTLGNQQQPVMVDTIVMANLGYFQMKGYPGSWVLKLRPGRSSEIYSITSHEGTDTPAGATEVQVVISSLRSHVVKVRVTKQSDKQHLDLLADEGEDAPAGLWDSITSTFSSTNDDESSEDTINIFSVASGHLYERFLRIMMASVRRHTKSPVKFWFLKNFLSPNFKDGLPNLADEYNIEYELVQYKWPRWLHQQTEKQRIIWGYKILFLDVLFPLDVKKIIFVDADQIVRADMKELQEMDLEGAPYGFVPFCDSRKEMDGFRFWKQGYWRNHLAGRKYHISALFVVDLKKFRRIAAGDRLRGQYQGLSQDPNSLSNLDQDLPNNMIHQVRIKSLPMEWLWCETWCDESSKSSAKVIDLCNNPLTKEAKLDAAQRIVKEWSEYDDSIKDILAEGKINDAKNKENLDKQRHIEL